MIGHDLVLEKIMSSRVGKVQNDRLLCGYLVLVVTTFKHVTRCSVFYIIILRLNFPHGFTWNCM